MFTAKSFLGAVMFCVMAGSLMVNAYAEDYKAKVQESMKTLKAELGKLGVAKVDGVAKVSGKDRPALFFGTSKINGNYTVVDAVIKTHDGTATVFVKDGADYIRVSTNVMKDGESRAVGTPLAKNPAHEAIDKGEDFYGQVEILGTPYETGYSPIKDAAGATVGIYYVGYPLKK